MEQTASSAESATLQPPGGDGQQPRTPKPMTAWGDLTTGYDGIGNAALTISGNVWVRYGASGGSLVFGGAVAIVGVVATAIRVSGWTATDLIACLSFAALLIVIGTASALMGRQLQIHTFSAQVTAYGLYKDGVMEAVRLLGENKPRPPEQDRGVPIRGTLYPQYRGWARIAAAAGIARHMALRRTCRGPLKPYRKRRSSGFSPRLSCSLVEQEVSDLSALKPDPVGDVFADPGGSQLVGSLGLLG